MSASHLFNRWLHGAAAAESEMVQVTLEQIQPFTLNPRVTRNPGYDALKASIRARGLDNPPVLTRRPGLVPNDAPTIPICLSGDCEQTASGRSLTQEVVNRARAILSRQRKN